MERCPAIPGGIEASLRRTAHYDHWSIPYAVRAGGLKADMLMFSNGERPLVEVAHRLAQGEPVGQIPRRACNTAIMVKEGAAG